MDKKTKEFVLKYGVHPDVADSGRIIGNFIDEMEEGLKGREKSLAMLPSYLSADFVPVKDKKYVVADAGGSNFRCGVAWLSDKGAEIKVTGEAMMPGITGEVTAKEFYGTLAGHMKEALSQARDIGFCFSYPVEMEKNADGRLIQFTKEIKCKEAEGRMVGKSLLEAAGGERRVTILNDTVATLLGGKGVNRDPRHEGCLGFIYGTGVNICYEEERERIVKAGGGEGRMIVNIEAGNFSGVPAGIIDERIERNTVNPGKYRFEKMTSGRYLGSIAAETLICAGKEGLFTVRITEDKFPLITTRDLSEFAADPESVGTIASLFRNDKDLETAYDIAESIISRAAKLCACIIAAAAHRYLESEKKSFGIVAEGSTFYKLHGYRQKFEKYLSELTEKQGASYDIISGKGLNLAGALFAAMYNENK